LIDEGRTNGGIVGEIDAEIVVADRLTIKSEMVIVNDLLN